MEKNASGAGVARGGLFSTSEIKILICFVKSLKYCNYFNCMLKYFC